jgi:SAM-dependent methyltransferase
MTDDETDQVKQYYNQVADEYNQHYAEEVEGYPQNRIRRDIIVERLVEEDVDTVLDVGCGDGSVTLSLLKNGIDATGFDFAEEMAAEAQTKLEKNGYDGDRIHQDDLREELPREESYDAVIALGVFPHVPEIEPNLENVYKTLSDDGVALIQFRNKIFDIFTLNQYTYDFYENQLLRDVELPEDPDTALKQRIRDACNVTRTEPEKDDNDKELSYEDIYAPFSNPFTVENQWKKIGFSNLDMLFYNYHGMLPEFEEVYPDAFRKASLELEDPDDWRGYLMASSFILEGWKIQ